MSDKKFEPCESCNSAPTTCPGVKACNKAKIESTKLLGLLQELWDEYRVLVTTIDDATEDDVDVADEHAINLIDAISDTQKMAKLRYLLFKVGVKNIAGIL